MKLLTEDALILCKHVIGKVSLSPSQHWVSVEGRMLLVDADPENRSISGCPNYGVTMKPCTHTLKVAVGYSTFLRIDGQRICLDTVEGFTDGTPPGVVTYNVKHPGQVLVAGDA